MDEQRANTVDRCSICKGIPDHQFVETLHTEERLPVEVSQLLILGGYGLYGSEQVRKCPECGTYYEFLHDHDSESGVGYGYTDEAITRLTSERALALIEKIIETMIRDAAYWKKEKAQGRTVPPFLEKKREQIVNLTQEKDVLRDKLGYS